jgi:RNA polymerase-binding transcription factor DksA
MAATKKTPAKKAAAKKVPAKNAPAKKAAAKALAKKVPAKKAAATKAPAKKAAVKGTAVPATANGADGIPAPRGKTKDGITYTKDFDVKFLKLQHDRLLAERSALLGQANRLEDEANSLIEDGEMGDVQFDDESGEGDTMVVERERDLALSAQARQTIADIDAALARLTEGTYGYSVVSSRPIPRERLEAIPWATVLVEEKVGGIGRR